MVEPKQVDREALRLLKEGNWEWQPYRNSFVRKAREGERPGVTSLEDLDKHKLVPHPQDVITQSDRQKGLRWLRDEIGKPNPKA